MKYLFLLGHLILSLIIILFTDVYKQEFFNLNNNITYLGVLLGFALTLYTFGISTLKDVYDNLDKMIFKDVKNKAQILCLLKQVFNEIEGDIKIIFYSIIAVFINVTAKETANPFGWDVEKYLIPEYFSILIFSLSTHAIYDIMKSLFKMSHLVFKREK